METLRIAKNGIPIYSYPNNSLHSFCLCYYLKAGSMYESDEWNGITHFFEHIAIRNINCLMSGELYRELDRLGLEFNGVTYKEFVQFSITGAPQYLKEAAQILTRILEPLKLSAQEISVERKRIKAEIRENDEKNTLDYFTSRLVWEGTSLANMIPGKFKNLDRIGKRALMEAAKELLTPENSFFYVTGRFEEEQIEYLSDLAGSYNVAHAREVRQNMAPVPAEFFRRNGRCEIKNSSYTYVRLTFDVDVSRYLDAELALLSDILFDGDYCKVFQELSEKTGYVYSFSYCMEKYCNLGNVSLSFEVQPQHLYDALETAMGVFRDIRQGIREELDYVRAPYTVNAGMLLDDAVELNWVMAYECHVLGEKYRTLEDRTKNYQQVSPEKLTDIAREIFRQENLLITMKAKQQKVDRDRIRKITGMLK